MYVVSREKKNNTLFKTIKCRICHNETWSKPKIIKLGFKFETVCYNCYSTFSRDNLELMANMFNAFGGYFGKIPTSKDSVIKILRALSEDSSFNTGNGEKQKLNIKFLHRALLHGINPDQIIHNLKLVD